MPAPTIRVPDTSTNQYFPTTAMSKASKLLALFLALVLAFSALAAPAASAANKVETNFTVSEKIEHAFYQLVDQMIFVLGRVLNTLIPGLNWHGDIQRLKDYTPENFYSGKETFDAMPADGAKWSMGFADASFLEGIDPLDGTFYMAGTLEAMNGRAPTEVLDDQGVNTYALSDGETTVVYSSIDGFGFGRGDVLEIRSRVADFAKEHGVDSINVSALHQHSCIDILGLGAPLVKALLKNPWSTAFKGDVAVKGRNDVFMEQVYSAVAASIVEAVENMSEGRLYFGSADIGEYMYDKRDPKVFDPEFARLRFVPDDADKNEIWVCEAGIHPVTLGAGTSILSADYPYYVEQYVKEQTGADMVFIQGSQLAITSNKSAFRTEEDVDIKTLLETMGATLGGKLLAIDNEQELEPLLNVTHKELAIKAKNPVHVIAGREGLLGAVMVRDGLGYSVVTEIGYMELGGSKLGVVTVPGEIDPAILWGGAIDAQDAWTGESWDYAPWARTCGAEKLICFGLCNDQIGYILTDNDVRSMLTENEEINALNFNSGSILTEAFEGLFESVKS